MISRKIINFYSEIYEENIDPYESSNMALLKKKVLI